MTVLTQCGAFGAMCTQVDGGIEHRLLAHPDSILNYRVNSTANGAMSADGTFDFNFSTSIFRARRGSLGFFDQH